MRPQYTPILFAVLVSLIVLALPLHAIAATTFNTISMDTALSSELDAGGTFQSQVDTYDIITSPTMFSVSDINMQLAPSGTTNYVALGTYTDNTGPRAYLRTNIASGLTCATGAQIAFQGHGCIMAVSDVTNGISADRLLMYQAVYNQNASAPYWFFYIMDDHEVFWQIAYISINDAVFSSPSLQKAVSYSGTSYLNYNPDVSTVWMHPEGIAPGTPNYYVFQTATTQFNYTNIVDALTCFTGDFGIAMPPMLDPTDFMIVGGPNMGIPLQCSGDVWPQSLSARSRTVALNPQRSVVAMQPQALPAYRASEAMVPPSTPDTPNRELATYTKLNLFPATDPLDQRSVRLGGGENGAFTPDKDVTLLLTADYDSSQAALSQWLAAHPAWQNARQVWGIPERNMRQFDKTGPDAPTWYRAQ